MHSYVHTREQNLKPGALPEHGESWLYLAVASTSKLILSYHAGDARDETNCDAFIPDLRGRVATIPLLNTDGLTAYEAPVARWFGPRGGPGGGVDYAQFVKNFSGKRRGKDYDRYAPAKGGKSLTTKRAVYGDPDLETCSTSFVERTNLSVRNHLKRFARRGTGSSKTLRHHCAMIAIFVAWFNFCRVHETLRCTPAMEAGLASHIWTVAEFVEVALASEPCEAPSPEPLKPRPEAPKTAERQTPTGARLKAIDGGKVAPKQTTIWTVLKEAKRQEERDKPDGAT